MRESVKLRRFCSIVTGPMVDRLLFDRCTPAQRAGLVQSLAHQIAHECGILEELCSLVDRAGISYSLRAAIEKCCRIQLGCLQELNDVTHDAATSGSSAPASTPERVKAGVRSVLEHSSTPALARLIGAEGRSRAAASERLVPWEALRGLGSALMTFDWVGVEESLKTASLREFSGLCRQTLLYRARNSHSSGDVAAFCTELRDYCSWNLLPTDDPPTSDLIRVIVGLVETKVTPDSFDLLDCARRLAADGEEQTRLRRISEDLARAETISDHLRDPGRQDTGVAHDQ